jgi:cyclic pyranopterin phosphate synthase
MPAEGVQLLSHQDIMTFDEIVDVVKAAALLGINKVRITGGEPLVRKGIVSLVEMIARIPAISDFSMTTNGTLLSKFAADLKSAGLRRVNVSLDTTDPQRFREITRIGEISQVIEGIDAAVSAGLAPVKINCVIHNSIDEPDARLVSEFGRKRGLEVRYIHEMDLDSGYFRGVIGGDGGNCSSCNRLRLTSNGFIKPCLFSNSGYSVRELGPGKALQRALDNKPECGSYNTTSEFYNLGG